MKKLIIKLLSLITTLNQIEANLFHNKKISPHTRHIAYDVSLIETKNNDAINAVLSELGFQQPTIRGIVKATRRKTTPTKKPKRTKQKKKTTKILVTTTTTTTKATTTAMTTVAADNEKSIYFDLLNKNLLDSKTVEVPKIVKTKKRKVYQRKTTSVATKSFGTSTAIQESGFFDRLKKVFSNE
jgi:hypothetical protein